MKSKILSIFLSISLLFGMSSCENYFGDINVDPNNPVEVTPDVLLPVIQGALAYLYGGDVTRYIGIYTEHIDGSTRQFSVIENYGISEADVNSSWDLFYAFVLQDIKELRRLAEAKGYNYYVGIAKILEAYTIMVATDIWGDIPYTQAFQGTDNLQPVYETQESIYNAAFQLLEEGKALMAGAGGPVVPGTSDLIFGGSASKWGKAAHAIKARAYLHLGKRDASNYTKALGELGNAFTALADDLDFPFGSSPSSSNPWFQYNEQRQDIIIGDSYVALMQSLNDPREAIYGATLNETHPYLTRSRPVILIGYTEQKFIEAEARMKTEGATAATHQAYLDAIAASFDHLGLSADYAAYVGQAAVDPGQANLTMNEIMTQKYIASFTDPEVFNDWRRTGLPAITPNQNSQAQQQCSGQIPRRLPYPQNEFDYNPGTPNIDFCAKVWWDQ